MRKRGKQKVRTQPALQVIDPQEGDKITVNDDKTIIAIKRTEVLADQKQLNLYLEKVRRAVFSIGRDVFFLKVQQVGKRKTGEMIVPPNRQSLLGFKYDKKKIGEYIVIV